MALGFASCETTPKKPISVSFNITREHTRFFTCNYWKDIEPYNNITDYPEEFIGIKDKFRKDEKLELVLDIPVSGLRGKEIQVVIYDQKGIPRAKTSKIMTNKAETIFCGRDYNLIEVLLEKGSLGEYEAVASIDGNYLGSHEFEITE